MESDEMGQGASALTDFAASWDETYLIAII